MNPEIIANLKKLPRNYTTWAVLAIIAAFDWWIDPVNAAAKAQILALFPKLQTYAPIGALVMFVVLRVLPQGGAGAPQADELGLDRRAGPATVPLDLQAVVEPGSPVRLPLEEQRQILAAADVIRRAAAAGKSLQ